MAFASASSGPAPRAEAACWLRVREDARVLEVESVSGEIALHADHPVFEDEGPFVHGAASDGGSALLGRRRASALYWFDLRSGETRTVPLPERLPRAEELAIHPAEAGFLVVTENGLLALDRRGRLGWQRDGVSFGARLVASTSRVYWIEDTGGDVVALDAATGAEVAGG